MPLSKKHYKAIAEILSEARANTPYAATPTAIYDDIEDRLVAYFKQNNPNFSESKFLGASSTVFDNAVC